MILVDTNVWLRIEQPDSEQGKTCLATIQSLKEQGVSLYICAQNLIEFWAVASRPIVVNGLGMDHRLIETALDYMMRVCKLLPEPADIGDRWFALARRHGPSGKRCHDLRLAAMAQAHGVSVILTLNPSDFRGIPGIEARTPDEF